MFEQYLDIEDCSCGRIHRLITRDYIVEKDAILKLPELLKKLALGKKPLAIYDSNTYRAAHEKVAAVLPDMDTLVLQGDDVHADEEQIDAIKKALDGHTVLLAVGSGVVCDVTRYVATEQKIPLIVVPTAASVDGYVSAASAMTLNGTKITLPADPPKAVVADLEIIAAAPKNLSASGVGDMLSKYISVADWHIGHLISGEYYCPFIANMETEAVDLIVERVEQIASGDIESTGKLMEGLLLSGIAMQLAQITRPASSYEHHVSHFLEVVPMPGLDKNALHGDKVGVATIFIAKHYAMLMRKLEEIIQNDLPNRFSEQRIREYYAGYPQQLIEGIVKENIPNVTERLDKKLLQKNFQKAVDVADGVPSHQIMYDTLEKIGGYLNYKDLGLSEDGYRKVLSICCYARNRFTVPRIATDFMLVDMGTLDL